jgi:hypothetical protein
MTTKQHDSIVSSLDNDKWVQVSKVALIALQRYWGFGAFMESSIDGSELVNIKWRL